MAWVYLLLAGVLEVAWATSLKWAMGHPRYWPLILAFVLSIASFLLLALAMNHKDGLPLGVAYSIWTGIGAVGAATCGILLFSESADPWRLLFIALIVAGILGLKLMPA
jgi:quaternary ammonium compound-resistance protein SugE